MVNGVKIVLGDRQGQKPLYVGDNHCGQIGNGTKMNQLTPQKILSNVVTVDSSSGTTVALTQNGDLYTWGSNQLSPKKVLSEISAMSIVAELWQRLLKMEICICGVRIIVVE